MSSNLGFSFEGRCNKSLGRLVREVFATVVRALHFPRVLLITLCGPHLFYSNSPTLPELFGIRLIVHDSFWAGCEMTAIER